MSAIFGENLIFSQKNGHDVELVVFGDEFYARYETKDGYTVVYDTDRGQYCYAILLNGRFASSGAPTIKPVPAGIRRHFKESKDVRNEKFNQRYSKMMPNEPAVASNIARTIGANEGLLRGRRVSEGQVRGLTVLVEFADVSTNVTSEEVDELLNADNYTQNGNFCSVREYFQLVSSGKLHYSNFVVGPIKLSQNRDYYKSNLFIKEAMDIVVNDIGINLSEFDSKGEGIVDALNFMYAGRTVYEGDLWPHNHNINLNYGGVRTHFYMLTSLGRERVDLSIGTFCHENGHQLCRFPDIYDYGTRDGDFEKSRGMGRYCLMASGNHLNRGRTPAPVCAYLRHLVGWNEREILLNSPGSHEVHHGDYETIVKYETNNPNEYFLIENRTKIGLDSHLPDSGLAVYHCDTLGSNEWQGGTEDRHYQCGLLQADGHLDLENNRNYGDKGDLFAEVAELALSHDTVPSSRQWDGTDSGLMLSEISAPGEIIRFTVGQPTDVNLVTADVKADLPIPDYEAMGVSSEINIAEIGKVKAIKVGVDISHTYIGDLQVELEAPSGKIALLHDQESGHQDDLQKTYNSDAVTELADLTNEATEGTWKLNVRDMLRRDIGRLNCWSIEIEYESVDKIASGESMPNVVIPDINGEGVNSAISIEETGLVKDINVSVEISHTYIGDLVVELLSPSGQRAIMHSRSGDGKNDLRMSYDLSSAPALETMLDQQIKGDWTLHVKDLAKYDEGVLEEWSIELTY
ncbi:M6 family metalloprotease domain-containing protein [Methanolobus sp. ZRKC3]|uniref:M6 family metalloprotease domain-containing protein n=1 Tax=Methanolobus sp. ZRKC3 TaxID=3125786 RepID=UPI00324BA35B